MSQATTKMLNFPAAAADLLACAGGTIRITATDYAADTILWLAKFLRQYPDIKVETIIDYGAGCRIFGAPQNLDPSSPADPRRAMLE